jgi:hypothetical protein
VLAAICASTSGNEAKERLKKYFKTAQTSVVGDKI